MIPPRAPEAASASRTRCPADRYGRRLGPDFGLAYEVTSRESLQIQWLAAWQSVEIDTLSTTKRY